MTFLLIVAVFLLLNALQAVLIARFGLRGFSYRRAFSRAAVAEGESLQLAEVIRYRGWLFLPWVRLEMRVPPAIGFNTHEDIEIRGGNYHRSVFTLTPMTQVTRRHTVTMRHRGHYRLDRVSLTAGDLLGMRTVTDELSAAAEIYVYPRLLPEDRVALPSSRADGAVSVRRWIQPDPFLVNGIRGYMDGDPERDIHWAATARLGALQVRTHDYTTNPRLMVLINGQRSDGQWGDLMDYEQAQIEYAISYAASLCVYALRRGLEAGFAASMPLGEGDTCACLPPARGAGWEDALLRAFADLRIRMLRSFPTFLEQLPRLSDTDIVILSWYDSPDIQRQIALLRRLGNSVTMRLLTEVPPCGE